MDDKKLICDSCGGDRVKLTITIRAMQLSGRLDSLPIREGKWFHCEECGRRWFEPAVRSA
jgi:hypothetical protein